MTPMNPPDSDESAHRRAAARLLNGLIEIDHLPPEVDSDERRQALEAEARDHGLRLESI